MERDRQRRFLESVDRRLVPRGFNRRSRTQEWKLQVETDQLWVHLNFGLGVINPSVGVSYLDLAKRWAMLPGGVFGTMVMVSNRSDPPRRFDGDTDPDQLASAVEDEGLAAVFELRDRGEVLRQLRSVEVKHWPVPSFSHRIRLAPVLMCDAGFPAEALKIADEYLKASEGRDQLVPSYKDFVVAMRLAIAS